MFLKKLSYFHFSVCSLAKNKYKIDTFFSMCNVSADFIAISETKLKLKCCTNIQIPNYSCVYVDSLTNAGDVGLYVNTTLQYTVRQDLELPIDGCEDLFIEVKSNVSGKNVLLEWSTDTLLQTYKLFSLHSPIYLKSCTLEKNNCIIGGDINANLLKY